MEMFDYSELIRVIGNIEIREEKEKNENILGLKKKLLELENSLIESGILDDWNRLKTLCVKAGTRLVVSHNGSDSIGYTLGVGDFHYCEEYCDDGSVRIRMKDTYGWEYYPGFYYDPCKGIVWKIHRREYTKFSEGISAKHWSNKNDEKAEYEAKIALLETVRDTYGHYREFQLKQIEKKYANRIKTEDIIKS